MKESAAGQDECTITMIRSAHELVQQAVLEVVNHMMLKDIRGTPWLFGLL